MECWALDQNQHVEFDLPVAGYGLESTIVSAQGDVESDHSLA